MSAPPTGFPPVPSPLSPPAKGRNALPWILGCGCLVLLVVLGIGIVGALVYYDFQRARNDRDYTDDVTLDSKVTYTNVKDWLPPSLQEHFIGFSFDYPERFEVLSDPNFFIKVAEQQHAGTQGDFIVQSFAVGYFSAPANRTSQEDQDITYPAVFTQLTPLLTQNFPNYRELGQITEHLDGQRGRSLVFQAGFKNTPKGDIPLYGKVIVARQPGQPVGVNIVMVSTSLNPEVKNAADVGMKGDLAPILASFKFAK